MRQPVEERREDIIAAVLDILDDEGYDAVQVRAVATRAKVSLSTIYTLFGTRSGLIAAAVERWMADNPYRSMPAPEPGQSPYEILIGTMRAVFEPWETHPKMLDAFYRASRANRSQHFRDQGRAVVNPIADLALEGADPELRADIDLIVWRVVRALLEEFVDGDLDVEEILPTLERTIYRLTSDNRISPERGR